jgi:DNA-directed RNA polymerase specialized sigma24 family protein
VREGFTHIEDDGTLVAACRAGDLGSCEQVVRRYALETLRTAYLLTDNHQRAWAITRTAFLHLFRELPKLDQDVDLRTRTLCHAATAFLSPAELPTVPVPLASPPVEGRPERYQVDDTRTRTRATLALIDPPARAALILREFNGLSVEQISSLLDERTDLTTVNLESSRRRIRNQMSMRADDSLRAAFSEAAFDAPSGNLWMVLEDEIAEIQRRAGHRSRIMSTVAVMIVITLLVGTLALLLRAPETEDVDASDALLGADPVIDPSPFPAIAPPRATGTNPARAVRLPPAPPTNVVPDTLLLALQGDGATDGLAHLLEFRPRHSIPIRSLIDWNRPSREHWSPMLSPDGQSLLVSHFESRSSETLVMVSAISSENRAVQWQAELARVPAVPLGDRLDVFVSLAVDEELVFVTLHFWRENDLIELVVLDLETGEHVNRWPVNISGRMANDVRVLRPPEGERVYVFAITQGQPALSGQMHISFYGYEVRTGREVHGKTFVEADDRRVFYIYQGHVTADGRSLYGVTYRSNTGALSVQFFDLATATVQPALRVPFSVEGSREPVQEAVSHDGRWLYIFSPLAVEIAIVDLEQRRLHGVIPLDVQLASGTTLGSANLTRNTMQISPDGSRIYAISSAFSRAMTGSGVWVIDTASWQLTGHWLPESAPVQILLNGDGSILYLHERSPSIGAVAHGEVLAIDTSTGQQLFREDLRFLSDTAEIQLESLAGLYRKQYGLSPVVADTRTVDNRAFTSLPAIDAAVTPMEIQAGAQVRIEVRFIHPLSGNLLAGDQDDVRFQSPPGLRAVLSDGSRDSRDIIVELGRRGYAEYHGSVTVDIPGLWSLSLVNDWSEGAALNQLVSTRATVKVISPRPGIGSGSLRMQAER